MSKEKPEVGDVWEYMDGTNVLVVNVFDSLIDCIYLCQDGILYLDSFQKDNFTRLSEYLGKSKVSIKELFDVRD